MRVNYARRLSFLPILVNLLWNLAQAGEFDGFWRSQGYGAVIAVEGDRITVYDETSISFYPVGEAALEGTRVNLGVPPDEEIFDLALEGDQLVASHRTSRLYLDRIAELPPIRGTASDAINVFNVFWRTIDEHFASFPLLDLDWRAVREDSRQRLSANMGGNELFDLLGDVGAHLLDGHTTLWAPDLGRFRNTGPQPSPLGGSLSGDVIRNVEREYIDGGHLSQILLDDRFAYGTIQEGRIGYLAIFDYEYRPIPFAQSLDKILSTLDGTEALIIDLRDNDGGDNWHAMSVSDRLTDRDRHVLTRVVRSGGPDQFGGPAPYFAQPAGQSHGDRPVYLLTNDGTASAGDVQTLMLSALPNVTQVGEPSRGMFSKFTRLLPNGWVMTTSNERFLSRDGRNYELQGVRPELAVRNTVAALNRGEDLIVDVALHDLDKRLPVEPGSVGVSAAMSGSWFAPDHDGEGFLVEILNPDTAVVYWFTYLPEEGRQAWMVSVGRIEGDRIRFDEVFRPFGARFGDDFSPEDVVREPWGEVEIRFTSCHRAVVKYSGPDDFGANYQSVQRLSGHHGLDCSGAVSGAVNGISGSWFNADRSGEGWIVAQLPDARVLMVWFTYDSQGQPVWLISIGALQGSMASFDQVLKPVGGRFGPGFDPAEVVMQPWGSMIIQFNGCSEASVSWMPSVPEFAAGEQNTSRLTALAGLECP